MGKMPTGKNKYKVKFVYEETVYADSIDQVKAYYDDNGLVLNAFDITEITLEIDKRKESDKLEI